MYEKIRHAVQTHLSKHRLVFWYDEGGKHRTVVDEIDTPASIVHVENNEWWIKYHVLKERPDDHFLIYAPYPRPVDKENWLLDLVLAGFTFSHDLSETHRTELELGPEFSGFIAEHAAFFQNTRDRFEPLLELVDPQAETIESLALKMIGILTAPDAATRRTPRQFSDILFQLSEDCLAGSKDTWAEVAKHGLDGHFRREVARYLAGSTDDLEPDGAAIAILREAWRLEHRGEETATTRSARVLVHRWREEYATGGRYEAIVRFAEKSLGIRDQLKNTPTADLTALQLFPVVDSVLAERLVSEAQSHTADRTRIHSIASQRKESYWVRTALPQIRSTYSFLIRYAELLDEIHGVNLHASSADELVARYTERLYVLDQAHRQCLGAYRAAGSPGSVTELVERMDGIYLHQFLQPLAESWDSVAVDGAHSKAVTVLPYQRRFFTSKVAPFLERDEKVVVIVSDAMRYEIGKELESRVASLNRLSASSGALFCAAPTVTAVGMNALLPHETLEMKTDGTVTVDGMNVAGIKGRAAHLSKAVKKRFPGKEAGAFWVRDILELPVAAARERIRGLDVIYLYSDRIDAIGDDAKTENSLPEAVETELESIVGIIRKFANQLNRTHILVTADHGFIFQNTPPEDAHLIAAESPHGGQKDRRYLAGATGPDRHFRKLTPAHLEIEAPHPLFFAHGLFRIRKQGGGVRFVHGGLSLQELVVPLVTVRVGRTDDVRAVTVGIMKSAKPVITTPEQKVTFFQEEPVSEKVHPITLRAAFVASDETVLSDTADITFDSGDPEQGNRATTIVLHLSPSAVQYNGQQIFLRLEKLIGGTVVPYSKDSYLYQSVGERDF